MRKGFRRFRPLPRCSDASPSSLLSPQSIPEHRDETLLVTHRVQPSLDLFQPRQLIRAQTALRVEGLQDVQGSSEVAGGGGGIDLGHPHQGGHKIGLKVRPRGLGPGQAFKDREGLLEETPGLVPPALSSISNPRSTLPNNRTLHRRKSLRPPFLYPADAATLLTFQARCPHLT